MLTDPAHALQVRDRLLEVIDALVDVYAAELEASAWPERHEAIATSGGEISDPTAEVALAGDRERDAGRLLAQLERLARLGTAVLEDHRAAVGR